MSRTSRVLVVLSASLLSASLVACGPAPEPVAENNGTEAAVEERVSSSRGSGDRTYSTSGGSSSGTFADDANATTNETSDNEIRFSEDDESVMIEDSSDIPMLTEQEACEVFVERGFLTAMS